MLKRSFIILLLVIMSCTEKVSIEPEFNDNTDWAPQITVEYNNYGRVYLDFGEWPPLEYQRNLASLFLQFRIVGETRFRRIATFDLPTGGFRSFYRSDPVIPEGIEYEARLAVQYRNGVEQVSNIARFFMPVVKGEILESVAIPVALRDFVFYKTSLLALSYNDELIQIDLNTLETTQLLSEFRPFYSQFSPYFDDITVNGETAIFAENRWDEPDKITVIRVNLQTLAINKSLKLSIPQAAENFHYGRIVHYDGSDIYVLWSFEGHQQIEKFDAAEGGVVASYPRFETLFYSNDKMFFDGTSFWVGINRFFDNRIVGFDLNSALVAPVHRNPLFSPGGLGWDGDSFWVYDHQTRSLVKLRLEGL